MNSAALLELDGLIVGYAQPVAGPVSLHLARGEVVGLAGPNGCGKTTLLGALAGETRIFGGVVKRAAGLAVSHFRQHENGIGGAPLAGRELLRLTGATAQGLPEWLADKLDLRLDRLSGGQRQFMRLWACLAAPADLVLLDEPTNNLDRRGAEFLAAHLRELARERRRALLLVSHDAAFVDIVCDRVVHLGDQDPAVR